MTIDLEELILSNNYKFDLLVKDGDNSFAGKLNLSPNKITLKIMGETSDQRKCSIGWGDIDNLVCTNLNNEFNLHDLRFTSGSGRAICHHPKAIGYFEMTFNVGYLIYCPSGRYSDEDFTSLDIHSETLCKWIGNTEAQERIIKLHQAREPLFGNPSKLTEFIVDMNSLGRIGVLYNLSMHSSSPDFKSGILFPPSLFISFSSEKNANELKRQYDKIYNLFSFLMGDEFLVDKINVGYMGPGFNKTGSLYYPSKSSRKANDNSCIFYPLGKDLRFDSLNLPAMSMDVFSNFLALSEIESGYFNKYLKYKRMSNVEERFIGFFRILETLCSKKKDYLDSELLSYLTKRMKPFLIKKFKDKKNVTSFIQGLPRYNSSKYNTEKCIQDFFMKIPTEISRNWKFQKNDIGDICKLRNDITHANDYYVSESDILYKTKFIQILLIFSLCSKIGIDLNITAKLIHRLNGYYLIMNR